MKIKLIAFCFLIPFVCSAQAQDTTNEKASATYIALYKKAEKALHEKRHDETLTSISEAIALQPKLAEGYNIRGQVLLRLKKYDEAIKDFHTLMELNSKYTPIASFNVGESYFQKKDYAQAQVYFQKFQETDYAKTFGDLGKYQIFLCDLMQNNKSQAQATLENLTTSPESPFYYYAHAAKHYHEKNSEKGAEYVRSAMKIYSRPLNSSYSDALTNLGWLNKDQQSELLSLNSQASKHLERSMIAQNLKTIQEPLKEEATPTNSNLSTPTSSQNTNLEGLLPSLTEEKEDHQKANESEN